MPKRGSERSWKTALHSGRTSKHPMNSHDHYPEHHVRRLLQETRSIAIVGASSNPNRPSFFVVKYMLAKGYHVFPINPGKAGGEIAGARVYGSLSDLPEPVDMVDVFRNVDALPGIASEIIALPTLPKLVWFQLGIRDDAIASVLETAGITVIQNRCPKIEYGRLCGEIAWVGYNRRIISARFAIRSLFRR